MHHSRVSAFVLDCQVDDLKTATEFLEPRARPQRSQRRSGRRRQVCGTENRCRRAVPAAAESRACPRIHLDIETDDIDAEVARLEALGATRLNRQALVGHAGADGHRFCVVRKQRPEFGSHLNTWAD
jgi:hypothetical protein